MSEENPFAELEQSTPKTKLWFIIVEKIVAILLFLLGSAMFYALFTDSGGNWGFYEETYGFFEGIKLFLRDNGYVLTMTVISLFSGVFLFLKRKEGWIGTMAILTHMGAALGLSFLRFNMLDIENGTSDILISVLVLLLLALIVLVMTRKQAQIRYLLTKRDYYFPAGLFLLFYALRYLTLGQIY
ncbi:MAG: hypothetical protein Aureis2KO_09210 [Aureisphaera sp.]